MNFILQQLLNIFRIPAEDKHCCRYSLSYSWAITLMTASSKRESEILRRLRSLSMTERKQTPQK